MGVILFVMVMGCYPFDENMENDDHLMNIVHGRENILWAAHEEFRSDELEPLTPEFKNLVTNLIAYDPKKRPSICEALEHPWFQHSKISQNSIIKKLK